MPAQPPAHEPVDAAHWRRLLERIPVVSYIAAFADDPAFLWVSPQVEVLLGHTPDEFLADDDLWYRCIHPDDVARVKALEAECYATQTDFECEYRMRAADGTERVVWERDLLIEDEDGVVRTSEGVLVDVTDLRRAEQEVRAQRDLAERYLEAAGTVVLALNRRGRVELLNRAGHELLGLPAGALDGKNWFTHAVPVEGREEAVATFAALMAGDEGTDVVAFESEVLGRDGVVHTIAWRNTPLRDAHGRITGMTSAGIDVTERRRAEQQVAFLAYHDPLTKLPNRALLAEHLELALARARRDKNAVALLYLDLDDFKLVNDSLGHAAGDRLLTKVALRLQARRREADLLARHGGDEFLVLLSDLPPTEALGTASQAATGFVEALAAPFVVSGAEFQIGASVGISLFPHDAQDAETLLRHADAAMYQGKAGGHGEVRVFDGERSEPLRALSMTSRLRHAIEDEQLVLHWQPIVDLVSGNLNAVEALVRWRDPLRGLVQPSEFVPFSERSGLVERLGEHVLELACRQRVAWRQQGFEPTMNLNVSPRELRRPGFVRHLATQLEVHAIDPTSVVLEITESTAMQDPERTLPVLRALAAEGMRIAIDDFGAGYSSLGRLIEMPVHHLKIDRTFLAAAPTDAGAAAVLAATVSLAQALNLTAVAEGVETEEQRELVMSLGCPLAQGFLLGRPVEGAVLASSAYGRPAAA